jgi:hypothetical protein
MFKSYDKQTSPLLVRVGDPNWKKDFSIFHLNLSTLAKIGLRILRIKTKSET